MAEINEKIMKRFDLIQKEQIMLRLCVGFQKREKSFWWNDNIKMSRAIRQKSNSIAMRNTQPPKATTTVAYNEYYAGGRKNVYLCWIVGNK